MVSATATLVAALNLILSVWAFRYTMRREPRIHGIATKVRWSLVAAGLAVAAAGAIIWGGTLLGDRVCFLGYSLAVLFFIFRSLSLQVVALWARITTRPRA